MAPPLKPPPDFDPTPLLPEPEEYRTPDIDHPPVAPHRYPDWTPETTRIALIPRHQHETWEEARAQFERRYGRVFEDCSTARWWAARVPRRAE